MDQSEAREHLEMVERIVAASSRKLETGAEYFIVWGIAGATMDALLFFSLAGALPLGAAWLTVAVLAAAIGFSIWRSTYYRRCATRMSFLQREYLNVLWLTIALAVVANVVGFNIFKGWAGAAIWNVAEAIVLFYIGMHGNRRAQICGILLVLSIALANFIPAYNGLILAAGVLFGYAGFGLADLLARE